MLRWYAALAILSRGSTSLGLLALSFVVSKAEFGLIGLAFIAITSASQVFGYPGYLAALSASNAVQAKVPRFLSPPLLIGLGAFLFILFSFWTQLAEDHLALLFVTAGAGALTTVTTISNGLLQKLKAEKFAATVSGVIIVPMMILAVIVGKWNRIELVIGFLLLAHASIAAVNISYMRRTGQAERIWSIRYQEFFVFSISGLVASALLLITANLLFERGGPAQMAELSFALQIRALLIFGAGVAGSEILTRYSDAIRDRPHVPVRIIAKDCLTISTFTLVPAGLISLGAMVPLASKLQPLLSSHSIFYLVGSAIFISVTVPISRAITAAFTEMWNVAINVASTAVCVLMLWLATANSDRYSLVLLIHSLMAFVVSILVYIYLSRRNRV